MTQKRLLAVLVVVSASALGQMPPRLAYHVEVTDRDFEAFHYSLEIDRPQCDEVRLSVAAWAPGSYRLMRAAKNIQDVAATDEHDAAREVRHEGELTWIVAAKGAEHLTVKWEFRDPGSGVNNRSYLNSTGGLLDGPRNYLY